MNKKTFKASRADKVISLFKNKEIDISIVNLEIDEREKDYYHVLLLNSKPNAATLKFDHKVEVKKYNPESYSKAVQRKSFQQIGINSKMIVLHDPTIKSETFTKTDKPVKELAEVLINKIAETSTVAEVEDLLVDEKRPTVLKAAKERIEFLQELESKGQSSKSKDEEE